MAASKFSVLTPEDIRGIQHQLSERRKARKVAREALRAERDQDNEFRAMIRGIKDELGGMGSGAYADDEDESEEAAA